MNWAAFSWSTFIPKAVMLNINETKGTHWGGSHRKIEWLKSQARSDFKDSAMGMQDRVRVEARISYPDRIARDVGNYYPTLKAYVDGLVDVDPVTKLGRGMLPDDSDVFLDGPFLQWSGEKCRVSNMFLIDITVTPLNRRILPADAVGPKLQAKLALIAESRNSEGQPVVL